MIKDQLSILIPTYNRWDILAKTLARTLSQLPPGFTVKIVNNASTSGGREQVEAVIANYPDVCVKIVDNRANIGGDANILRCVELCETPHVIILGDDDYLRPDAFLRISSYFEGDAQYGWIHFFMPQRYKPNFPCDIEFDDPYGIVAESGNWAELLFISTTVFSRDLLLQGFDLAQRHQGTFSSHLIAVLKGWDAWVKKAGCAGDYKFVMSSQTIIETWDHGEQLYNNINLYQGMPQLQSVFSSSFGQSRLIKRAVRGMTKYVFKPRVLGKNLAHLVWHEGGEKGWLCYRGIQGGLRYMIGFRSLYYRLYYPLLIAVVALARLFKRT